MWVLTIEMMLPSSLFNPISYHVYLHVYPVAMLLLGTVGAGF